MVLLQCLAGLCCGTTTMFSTDTWCCCTAQNCGGMLQHCSWRMCGAAEPLLDCQVDGLLSLPISQETKLFRSACVGRGKVHPDGLHKGFASTSNWGQNALHWAVKRAKLLTDQPQVGGGGEVACPAESGTTDCSAFAGPLPFMG